MTRLLTLAEVAELAGVHYDTVRREIKRGRLDAIIVGERLVRVPEDAALRWLQARPVTPDGYRDDANSH